MKGEVVVYLSHLLVLCLPGPLSFLKLHVSHVHGRTAAFPAELLDYVQSLPLSSEGWRQTVLDFLLYEVEQKAHISLLQDTEHLKTPVLLC